MPVKAFLAKKCYMADMPFYDVTIGDMHTMYVGQIIDVLAR